MGKEKDYNKEKYEDCLNSFIAKDLSNIEESIIIKSLIDISNNKSSISRDDLQNRTLKQLLEFSYETEDKFAEKIKTTLKNQNFNKTALSITLLDDLCKIFDITPNELLQIDSSYFHEIVYFEDNAISNITATIFSPEKTIFKEEKEFFYEEFICRAYPFLGLSLKATYDPNKQSYSYIFFYSLSIKDKETTDNDYFEHFHPSLNNKINSAQDIDILTESNYEEALLEFRKKALKVYNKYFSGKTFPLSDTTNTYKTNAITFFDCISTQISQAQGEQTTIDETNCTNDSSYHSNKQNKKSRLDEQMNNAKSK